LLGVSAKAVQQDRLGALDALVERYGGTVVLKGAGTLVATAGEISGLCERGNPGMATPGAGDVLTGYDRGDPRSMPRRGERRTGRRLGACHGRRQRRARWR
jgi:hypothetical protein